MFCNAYDDMPNFSARSKHQRCYSAALRADMKGDRLNSRFQHIHKNKSAKAYGAV